jgi:hypothetical protein
MKTIGVLLAGSVALNVGLALVTMRPPIGPTTVDAARSVDVGAKGAEAKSAETALNWERLFRGNETDVVNRLRAEGFPPRIIRMLARMKLDERFAARRAELAEGGRVSRYWRDSLYGIGPAARLDPKQRAQRRALEDEYAQALKQLLGSDPEMSEFEAQRTRRLYGDLPPEKIRQFEAINKDYEELAAEVRGETLGVVFPEDEAQLELLEKERQADLARMLSPEELEEYELRASRTASGLRSQLAAFDPSEAEFRALFQVQQAYEERYKGRTLTADESREAREAMVAEVLSPERFEEYRVTTAGAYQPLSNLVSQLKLPTQTVSEVLGVQWDITRRATAVRNDAALTTTQREAQLAALARDATDRLTKSLGAEGYQHYRASIANWLRQLPPPAPAQAEGSR